MPTRTALLITVGDVIETGPPETAPSTRYTHKKHRRRHSSNTLNNNEGLSSRKGKKTNGHKIRRQRRKRHISSNSRRSSSSFSHTTETSSVLSESTSSLSDFNGYEEPEEDVFISMRTRGSAEQFSVNGSSNIRPFLNTKNNRRLRSHSESSPATHRSSNSLKALRTKRLRQRKYPTNHDDEVSFSDPLHIDYDDIKEEVVCNGFETPPYERPMPASKKKRKSSDEKFLEDNSDYYGIEVLPNKLRSSEPIKDLEVLRNVKEEVKTEGGALPTSRRERYKSATDTDDTEEAKLQSHHRRRQPRSSNVHEEDEESLRQSVEPNIVKESPGKRILRVDAERTKLRSHFNELDSDGDTDKRQTLGGGEEEGSRRQSKHSLRHRRSSRLDEDETSKSPSPKRLRRGRSELDKLLEAGSSSFHFETARQATSRMTTKEKKKSTANKLGPIHIDVSDNSNSSHDDHVRAKIGTRLARSHREPKELVNGRKRNLDKDGDIVQPDVLPQPKSKTGRRKEQLATNQSLVKPYPEKQLKRKKIIIPKKGTLRKRMLKLQRQAAKRGLRQPLLTKADLLHGPVIIPPKHELVNVKKNIKSKSVSSRSELNLLREYVPQELLDDLTRRLSAADGEPTSVDNMTFSFEKTPYNEPWFLTYTRQDQGDEIILFPETKWFPLPYEMPNTTFYPSKPGAIKRKKLLSNISSINPSGAATPEEEEIPDSSSASSITLQRSVKKNQEKASVPLARRRMAMQQWRKGSKSSSTDSEGSTTRKSGIVTLDPKVANNLLEFSRKSPRCHASTKALLTSSTAHNSNEIPKDEEDDMDVEVSSEDIKTFQQMDESKKPKQESAAQLVKLASTLDAVLTEPDPLLLGDENLLLEPDAPKERLAMLQKKLHRKQRRRTSSGLNPTSSSNNKHILSAHEDPMDRLVAANVDQLLLDCLEDECPSVTLDGEVPGASPLDLIANYDKCDSMAKCCNFKWTRRDSWLNSAPKCSSMNLAKPKPLTSVDSDNIDSSSEYATSLSSAVSGISGRRKKRAKRNLTGFPTIKKKPSVHKGSHSLLNNVLTKATKSRMKKQSEETQVRRLPSSTSAEADDADGEKDSDEVEDDESEPEKVSKRVTRKQPLRSKRSSNQPFGAKNERVTASAVTRSSIQHHSPRTAAKNHRKKYKDEDESEAEDEDASSGTRSDLSDDDKESDNDNNDGVVVTRKLNKARVEKRTHGKGWSQQNTVSLRSRPRLGPRSVKGKATSDLMGRTAHRKKQ